MTTPLQVNINIISGVGFTQEYTLTNSDLSAVDITGYTFQAKVAKHPDAINATTSTSDDPVWRYLPMTTSIVNAVGGVYSISLSLEDTNKLDEGKYVYSVVMQNLSDVYTEVVSGLAFVTKSFGYTTTGTIDPNF